MSFGALSRCGAGSAAAAAARPRRHRARSLGRRRHGNLRPRPRARPLARDRRGRRRRRRHRAGRQLRDRAARAMRPAMPRTSPLHGIGHGAQAAGTPAPEALAAFRDWCGRRRPVWAFTPISIGRSCARRSPAPACRRTTRHGSTLLRSPERWPPTRIAPASAASTTGWRHSASNARPATTPRPTRSRPPSCCCGCVSIAAKQGRARLRRAGADRAPAEMAGQRTD